MDDWSFSDHAHAGDTQPPACNRACALILDTARPFMDDGRSPGTALRFTWRSRVVGVKGRPSSRSAGSASAVLREAHRIIPERESHGFRGLVETHWGGLAGGRCGH